MGDTYNKLFCDPKLPFADCALKWAAANKIRTRSEKMSSDEDEDNKDTSEESKADRHMSLRRSKRNSNNADTDVVDEDTDALSELENLAKLGRSDEPPPPSYWFGERALETRLHHIAHTVQNSEWPPSTSKMQSGKSHEERKKHIAIDVETERAKLQALLSEGGSAGGRDDASSDSGSRRSTPAPPPAHQRAPPTPISARPDGPDAFLPSGKNMISICFAHSYIHFNIIDNFINIV